MRDDDKVRPLHQDQTVGSKDNSLLMDTRNDKNNKKQWKAIDKET